MGIWMWVVPEKVKDSNGQEFTVVLLNSEGIDAVTNEGSDDHCIFTLTILLASVLIYNSAGVLTKNDLDGFDFMSKLSQQIQLNSSDETASTQRSSDSKLFNKTFPLFFVLLNDDVFGLPKDCRDTKEYFLKYVFTSTLESETQVATTDILNFFPGFDAFNLPSPASDSEVNVLSIYQDTAQEDINKAFVQGVNEFKEMLRSRLAPKRSFNDGEYVTGEGLASLAESYVAVLSTPGTVPSVQSAWETFLQTKFSEATAAANEAYNDTMGSNLGGLFPCDSDEIRKVQHWSIEEAIKIFQAETVDVSTASSEKHIDELMEYVEEGLSECHADNNRLTKISCLKLLTRLKERHLDPLIEKLKGKDGATVSFAQIMEVYSAIEQGFQSQARGAKEVCAQAFCELHPELQSELTKHVPHFQQLEDYDEALVKEKEDKAFQEQERRTMEEESARLEEKRYTKEKEIELLKTKHHEDKKRLEGQQKADSEAQHEQIQNMMTVIMEGLRKEREAAIQQNLQSYKDVLDQLRQSMEKKNKEMADLELQIVGLKSKPPPEKKGGECAIL